MTAPYHDIVLGKTYYTQGFFNVGVAAEKYLDARDTAEVVLEIEGSGEIPDKMERTSHSNGTPRVFGGPVLRDWIQKRFDQGDTLRVHMLSKTRMRLSPCHDAPAVQPKTQAGRLTQITPLVPCTSLQKQRTFYEDILGFTCHFQSAGHAYLTRDKIAIRLNEVSPQIDLKHPERENSFYIDVENIDAVFLSMRAALHTLPRERVRAPFNQSYGQREFHVTDEDCPLIFFGETVS